MKTKRILLVSCSIILLCLMIITGLTYALFTDQFSVGNHLEAGRLNVTLERTHLEYSVLDEFGAFLEFAPGKEAMVHISKISKERIDHVEDVLTLGDVVKAVCLGKDKMGRVSFSIKDVK